MGFALSDISLSSSAFAAHANIPAKYTGDGEDVSPPLAFAQVPAAAKSLALFCHDPDAPLAKPGSYDFSHWLLYNLAADTCSLAEASSAGTAGINDFGNSGYNGPLPPNGHGNHHYYFWLLALDADLKLPAGLTLEAFLARAEPHIIAMNRLVGIYRRD